MSERLGPTGAQSRVVRWGIAVCIVVLALVLVDARTGLLRRGRAPGTALLVDALLLAVGAVAFVAFLRRGSRGHDRRR